MPTKLFVAQLSFDTTDYTLKTLFQRHGTVASAKVIADRVTGRSKGFGFVDMESADEAKAAIKALDGREFEGRAIAVSIARPQPSSPQSTNYSKQITSYNKRKDSFRNGFRRG